MNHHYHPSYPHPYSYNPPPLPPPPLFPHPSSSSNAIASSSKQKQKQALSISSMMDPSPIPQPPPQQQPAVSTTSPNFDIIDWHPAHQSCQRFFLDHAQHEPGTQALCALINIRLPCQWHPNPLTSSSPAGANNKPDPAQFTFTPYAQQQPNAPPNFVSLVPYIRRLIVTGFDKPPILHGFFGDAYTAGVLPLVDCERRNYLFAAKHGGWRTCKTQYDQGSCGGGIDETVPFMKPLEDATGEELAAAEKAWGEWLAMEDWMVGPRKPEGEEGVGGSQGSGREGGRGR